MGVSAVFGLFGLACLIGILTTVLGWHWEHRQALAI